MGEYVHSKQARFDKSYVSCGVMEVHHLPEQSASKTLFSVVNALYHKANPRPAAFVIFSDICEAGMTSRGEALAIYIESAQSKIGGDLHASRRMVNPKTGNVICIWLWTLDHDMLRKWYADELMNRVEETS